MLAKLLYAIWPYQIFTSTTFRSGLAFIFTYVVVVVFMPTLIRRLRNKGVTSDFVDTPYQSTGAEQPYLGAKPMMGGVLLMVGILLAVLLWADWNEFVWALMGIMLSFGMIGAADDLQKIRHRKKVEKGEVSAKSYADKADGISGTLRLLLQFAVAGIVVVVLYWFVQIDGHIVVPLIPLDWWYPYLPRYLFLPFMVFVIVAAANAVNLTDGMDTLATVPVLSCAAFSVVAVYIGADEEWSKRLLLPNLPIGVKESVVVIASLMGAGIAFLRFNAPPAMITLGDSGALAFGSMVATMFIFVKAELFLPLAGGVFVLTTLSTIIQRLFFKWMLWRKGRSAAMERRFFYRAPYHHHLQALWSYQTEPRKIISVWVEWLAKWRIMPPRIGDQLRRTTDVNSRVIWHIHILSLGFFALTLLVYFKVR